MRPCLLLKSMQSRQRLLSPKAVDVSNQAADDAEDSREVAITANFFCVLVVW